MPPEENFEQQLRKLVFEDNCDLDDAFTQAKNDHQNLAGKADKLFEIKQKVALDLKNFKRKS
ncbi:hypothetical protein XM38_013130 [Halomicronema hongdechloris C2206]|uniref:Uncharacterized protein n=1 Tax=Halomicronema hongdechloris C2206 TaxID=1641165 RepID=A0A1V8NEQ3_9CYAN|nr:hypothetical protein [Halomicronema hongdechloris]ASC70375.1 hypothetical protein XM38_013130 [Halomicronema hongdechloris C2206]